MKIVFELKMGKLMESREEVFDAIRLAMCRDDDGPVAILPPMTPDESGTIYDRQRNVVGQWKIQDAGATVEERVVEVLDSVIDELNDLRQRAYEA